MKRANFLAVVVLLGGLCPVSVAATEHWICVSTPHFEMYTTNGERQAIRALQAFEQVRYFFVRSSVGNRVPESRVRIIAFNSENDYRPYRINSGGFAYYLQSRARDYIVMQDIEPQHYPVAMHEYTHLIVQHSKLDLPVWLNEGLADLYSSLEPHGSKTLVGRPLPARVAALSEEPWMDWEILLRVDAASPFYNQREKMRIFYAQSWALTHMLAISRDYSAKFSQFVDAVNSGIPTADALQKIYGKSVSQVGADTRTYIHQFSLHAGLFNIDLRGMDIDVQSSDLSSLQVNLALADILAGAKATEEEARRNLVAVAGEYPQSVEIQESLGYLAWQQDDTVEARKRFALAVRLGSQNSQLIYDFASLEFQAGDELHVVPGLLKKVIAFQPDHIEARLSLAEIETMQGHYGTALGVISPVSNVPAEQAFRLFSLTAYIRANLRDSEGARAAGVKALRYVKSTDDRLRVEQLLQSIEAGNGDRSDGK